MNNFCSQIVSDAAGLRFGGLAHRVQEMKGEDSMLKVDKLKGVKRHTWF